MMDAAAWIGPVRDVWASEWRRTDRSFAGLAPHLDAAIAARAPDRGRAVDIGCGAGATTIALAAARPALEIVGIDLSPALVMVARDRASAFANTRFLIGAAEEVLPDVGAAGLLFSRHGVMFFDDPAKEFAALRSAAAPGAWLVFSCFAEMAGNAWANDVVGAVSGAEPAVARGYAPGPFAFADPAVVDSLADGTGWRPEPPVPVEFAYVAGGGDDPVADAVGYFTRVGPAAAMLRAMERDGVTAAMGRLRTTVERRLVDGVVAFPATAWVWSMRAI